LPGPTATFGFILATLLGAGFHLVVGGDIRRLALFLLSAWIGFTLGHILGTVLLIDLLRVGTLRTIPAVLGALVALVAAHILTVSSQRSRT
jgi:hypothetical protein